MNYTKNMKRTKKAIYSNWPYIFWFLIYFFFFWFFGGASLNSFLIILAIYTVSILFSISPLAEKLWRSISGVRPVATAYEWNRLMPLFNEVYQRACRANWRLLKRHIQLYIKEDMEVNAFAFGRNTLVLTRGSIELLNDECLKGLIAHEFGHFSHLDTYAILLEQIGNSLLSVYLKLIRSIANLFVLKLRHNDNTFTSIHGIFNKLLMGLHKMILFLGDMILKPTGRQHELMADSFARYIGYGRELVNVLYQMQQVSIHSPGRIIEQLKSTHPPLYQRIQQLERQIYYLYR